MTTVSSMGSTNVSCRRNSSAVARASGIVALVLLFAVAGTVEAFAPLIQPQRHHNSHQQRRRDEPTLSSEITPWGARRTPLAATASEKDSATEEGEEEESMLEPPLAEDATDADDDDTPEEAEEISEEEAALAALKDEIMSLEVALKGKRRNLASIKDQAEEYTKTGYARKVAEMENMRRARSILQSSNRAGATASILTEFLPVYDRLMVLSDEYEGDEFGKQYGALAGNMKQVFTSLEVAEFEVQVGDAIDKTRMVVVESEYSDAQPADTVLQAVRPGMELAGNVVRCAECVASLGAEQVEEAEQEEAVDEE